MTRRDLTRRRGQDLNAPATDGILPRVWDALREAIVSAKKKDLGGYAAASEELTGRGSRSEANTAASWAFIYMRFMLWAAVMDVVHAAPSVAEIVALGQPLTPDIVPPFTMEQYSVSDILLAVFDLAGKEAEVHPGIVVSYGPAVLAALLDDPKSQLASMRLRLAKYCAENADEFALIGRLERGEPTS